jgi:hypothetical protein
VDDKPVNVRNLKYYSGMNESGLDIENEFDYATDEDSLKLIYIFLEYN